MGTSWPMGSYTNLTGFYPQRLKGYNEDELPRKGPHCLCGQDGIDNLYSP